MPKNILLLFLSIFCSSCIMAWTKTGPLCQSIYRSETLSSKTKTFLCGDGGGIKYRCKTANDCCEVGKNCEEDLKKEESKK